MALITCFLAILIPVTAQADPQIPLYEDPNLISNLDVKRDLYVSNYGIVTVIDNFTIQNIGNEIKTYIQMGIPEVIGLDIKDFDSLLTYFKAFGEGNEELAIDKLPYDGSGIQKWNIYLSDPIYPGETSQYLIKMIFHDLINYLYYYEDGYLMDFYEIPSSAYEIVDYELVIHRPDWSTEATSSGLTKTDIDPWDVTALNWQYKIDAASYTIIECTNGKREIKIDSWGYIQVDDFYRMKNIGDGYLQTFTISIPANYINGTLSVFDTTSVLLTEVTYPSTLTKHDLANITIKWSQSRNPLYKNQEASIWIQYRLPLEDYQSFIGDKIKISLDLQLEMAEWPIKDFDIELSLPKGAIIATYSSLVNTITNLDGSTMVTNSYDVIIYNDETIISIQYYLFSNLFWANARPFLIILVSLIGLSAYIVTRREIQVEKIVMSRPKLVPSAIIREYISIYSEKIALDLDLEKLEDEFTRGKIKKRIFKTQYKIIERKMIDIDKEVKVLNVHFITAGGRFKQIIENLDLYEAEKIHARDGIKNLEKRYKMTGRISSAAFQKLRNENVKRLGKSKNNIDKVVEELRTYIA